jgi:hypothetical protein
MSARPEEGPGRFKEKPNPAGSTDFVAPVRIRFAAVTDPKRPIPKTWTIQLTIIALPRRLSGSNS